MINLVKKIFYTFLSVKAPNYREEGRVSSAPPQKLEKKFPDFGKRCPGCGYLQVKFLN